MIKALFLTSILCFSAMALENTNKANFFAKRAKKALSNFNFNYFVSYSGPSLSSSYKKDETWNRFDGGVDAFNEDNDLDNTSSVSTYQSFKLGYSFQNNWNLSYGVTMQESLKDNVNFRWPNGASGVRNNGRSYNGHRLSLFIPEVSSFSIGWLSTNLFYELPVAAERNNGTIYSLGIQPSLSLYSSIPGLSHGVAFSYKRVFMRDEKNPSAQGVKVSIAPYINYTLSERFTLKNAFDFDWDQKGEDINTSNFSRNMHDVGKIGLGTKITNKVYFDIYLTYSVYQLDAKNTSMGAALDISI